MANDPFQHFGEQQLSFELLEEHRAALREDALELLAQHPQLELVGLILDGSAAEAAPFQAAFAQASGQRDTGRGFFGVVTRDFVVQILRANAPATLDWLPPSRQQGGQRMLPLCAATRHGYRFGAIACNTGTTDPA